MTKREARQGMILKFFSLANLGNAVCAEHLLGHNAFLTSISLYLILGLVHSVDCLVSRLASGGG